MAITRSTAAARVQRTVKAESGLKAIALLVGSSAIVAFGLLLTYNAKADSFAGMAERLRDKQVVNLNETNNSAEIASLLTLFGEADERQFVAKKIYEFLTGADTRSAYRREVANIYDLSRIRVEEKEAGPKSRLEVLKKRFADERARQEQKAAEAKAEPPASLTLPLLTRSQLNGLKPLFVVREPAGFRNMLVMYAALYFASFYLVFIVWRVRGVNGDSVVLPIIHMLTGIGFMAMVSLRDPLRDVAIFADFNQGVVGGALLMMIAGLIDYQRSTLRKLSFIPLILAFALSAALVVFGKGPAGSDAKVNLLGFQPVELIKILIVLFLAGYFASHWEVLRELKAKPIIKSLKWANIPRLQYILPLLVSMAVVLGFFFLQKDLGPALIIACSFLALYGVARNRFALVGVTLGALVAVFYVGYLMSFPATVADRIHMWLSPWDNMVRGGDQLAHSLWALSTGAATGTGLGLGEPGYIPAGHTDLIGSTIGEELGYAGLLAVFALYAILIYRSFRNSLDASGDYAMFLGVGLTLIVAIEIVLIGGGSVGLLPLSGVVLPFLSFGKSSMIANFAIFGILASISARRGDKKRSEPFKRPVGRVAVALAALCIAVLGKAAYAQVLKADDIVVAGSLAVQGDGSLRYQYNPRIREIAREIPRGSILDRNGIPIATSRWEDLERNRKRYEELGINIDQTCSRADSRHYPFAKNPVGASLYHLIGDARYPINWAADNTSFFVEREYKRVLQGYDDKPTIEEVSDPRTGQVNRAVKYDYRELVPVLRNRYNPQSEDAKRLLDRNHDVRLSIDLRFQFRVAEILKKEIQNAKVERGSIVVLDPQTGDLLACASYPWPDDVAGLYVSRDEDRDGGDEEALFDRARWGIYPPGSTFKIVTAIAALQKDPSLATQSFLCEDLEGRPGARIKGYGRAVYDDESDRVHGSITLGPGIVYSCNAYFGQLGVAVGSRDLLKTANQMGIEFAKNIQPQTLRDFLPWASFGQHPVLATPFQMARVAAAIANDGRMPFGRWVIDENNERTKLPELLLTRDRALEIGDAMRGVVTDGTADVLRGGPVQIAGKTGTAEVDRKKSHSWFIGYAPYQSARKRIAFAALIENGGYGGRFAAPAAGRVVAAARDLGIIQ